MREIKLTQGYVALVDDEDFEKLNQYKWYAHTTDSNKIYAARHVKRNITELMHRKILNAPNKVLVDHKNNNTLDNQTSNLRLCTHSENMRNSKPHKNSSSQYKGVYLQIREGTSWWVSEIRFNSNKFFIGRFKNEIDAAKAYNIYAINLHKEFACLNPV